MRTLPESLAHYKSTPEFTDATIPSGLLRSHTTAAGVWGRIRVLEGSLLYRINEPQIEEHILTPAAHGVIEPGVRHEVAALGPVRFCVDFLRAPAP
jgi:tellurite resistance-related uncharacterized protein